MPIKHMNNIAYYQFAITDLNFFKAFKSKCFVSPKKNPKDVVRVKIHFT